MWNWLAGVFGEKKRATSSHTLQKLRRASTARGIDSLYKQTVLIPELGVQMTVQVLGMPVSSSPKKTSTPRWLPAAFFG